MAWDQADAAVNFTAPGNWTASSNASWVKISNEGGQFGERQLLISFEPNTYIGPRTATVMLVQGENKSQIKVTQAGCADATQVTGANLSVSLPGAPGSSTIVKLSEIKNLFSSNFPGSDFATITEGLGESGKLQMYVVDGEGNRTPVSGDAGTRLSTWVDSKGLLAEKKAAASYPENAVSLATQSDGTILLTRGAHISDDAEVNATVVYADEQREHFVTLALHITLPAYANDAITLDGDTRESTISFEDMKERLEAIGIDEAAWKKALQYWQVERTDLQLVMLDANQQPLAEAASYNSTTGKGYKLDAKGQPTNDNVASFVVEPTDEGLVISRQSGVAMGRYQLSCALQRTSNPTQRAVFIVDIECSPAVEVKVNGNQVVVNMELSQEAFTATVIPTAKFMPAVEEQFMMSQDEWDAVFNADKMGNRSMARIVFDMLKEDGSKVEEGVVKEFKYRIDANGDTVKVNDKGEIDMVHGTPKKDYFPSPIPVEELGYSADGNGFWLNKELLPTRWGGVYSDEDTDDDPEISNSFYVAGNKDMGGVYIGCKGDGEPTHNVPAGQYTMRFQYSLRVNPEVKVAFEVHVTVVASQQ